MIQNRTRFNGLVVKFNFNFEFGIGLICITLKKKRGSAGFYVREREREAEEEERGEVDPGLTRPNSILPATRPDSNFIFPPPYWRRKILIESLKTNHLIHTIHVA